MNRIALKDGGWFNPDRAERFVECTYFDGKNYISKATSDQFRHEALYRTRKNRWVLKAWSDWQGTTPSWTEISADHALSWLIKNEHELPPEEEATWTDMEI